MSSFLQRPRLRNGRQLRIALAIGTLNRGGAETQLVGLARELHVMGHHVEVLLLNGRGPLQDGLDELGIPTWCAGIRGFRSIATGGGLRGYVRPAIGVVCRLLALYRHVWRGHYDILHAYLFFAYALLIPWAWLVRVPVRIAARRGLQVSLEENALLRPLTRLSTVTATAVLANANAVADDAHLHEAVPRSKLYVIRNAVALPPVHAQCAVEPPTGLLVANLIRYKGHLDLVAAVQLMNPSIREKVRVRCIGEGPMRAEITAARDHAGLRHRLILEGTRAAVPLYLDAQYALLVSHEEGLPNAVMEAMAAGLPVVATDVGGSRELVQHGVTGLLVPPRDPEALAGALTRVIQDGDFRVEAGRRGRERAAELDWTNNARTHVELYRSLLQPRRK
jgi:glycosyltransferase involved in cell wall biosynthesis